MTMTDGYKFVAFTGKSKEPDGSYLVSGKITDSTLDLDQQRVDPEWAEKAVGDWFRDYGNIREMHQPVAVGKAKSLSGNGSDGFDIIAKVVDPVAINKLENDIYTGFSIGIKGTKLDKTDKALAVAPQGIINGGKIIEVSIVDVPANPNAKFTLAKAAEIGDTLDLQSVVDHVVPCTECSGIGKILVDSVWSECPKCGGDGAGAKDVYPSLASGPENHGEVGKKGDPDCKTCDGTGKIKEGHVDCPDCVQKSTEPDDGKKTFTDKERADLADKGDAMTDGSYPIRNVADLKNAIQAYGRAKNKAAVKSWIKKKAKELGHTDLLPEEWSNTSKMADAMAGLSTMNKSAEPGQWVHDPAVLDTIQSGIVTCIEQELEELTSGEDERWDLQDLMSVLNGFLSWRIHEAFGGETSSPFDQGDDMDLTTLGVSPDTIKAARADDATDEQKAAPLAELVKAVTPELVKALGLDTIATSTEEVTEKVASLVTRLDTVEKMSAPRGYALRASAEQQEVSSALLEATNRLNLYKSAQAELATPEDRAKYDAFITEAQSKVDALSSKIGA